MLRHIFVSGLFLSILATSPTLVAEPPAPATPARAAVDLYGDPLPVGAKARIGSVRYRAETHLLGFAFAAGGKEFVTASQFGPIVSWDAATGRRLKEIYKGPEQSLEFVFSADGKWGASRDHYFDDTALQYKLSIRYWDLTAGKVIWALSENGEKLCLSPDGTRLAFVGLGKIHIWDCVAGVEMAQLDAIPMSQMAFSPDGKWLAYPDGENLHIWNWSEERAPRIQAPPRKAGRFYQIAFSSDSKTIAAHSLEKGGLILFDVAGEKAPRAMLRKDQEVVPIHVGFALGVRCLAVVLDGRKKKLLWDVEAGKGLAEFDRGGITNWCGATYSPDGTRVAMGDQCGTFGVWDAKTGKLAGKEREGNDQPACALTVIAGGKQIVTGTYRGTVHAWNLESGKLAWQCDDPERFPSQWRTSANGLALSPDGKWLALSTHQMVRVVDAANGRERFCLAGYPNNPGETAFTSDGKRLVTCDSYIRRLRHWSMESGKLVAEFAISPGEPADPERKPEADFPREDKMFDAYALSRDAARLAVTKGTKTYIFDTESGRELLAFDSPPHGPSLALSPDGKRLAACHYPWSEPLKLPGGGVHRVQPRHAMLRYHEATTGKLLREIRVPGSGTARAVFSPDGTLLAAHTHGWNCSIVVWHAETGAEVKHIHCGDAYAISLAISPDNKTLYGGMSNTSVLAWELHTK